LNKSEHILIVTGDIAMDWNLARARRSTSDTSFWSADDTARTTWQRGGAALLADLVDAIARDLQKGGAPGFSVRQTAAPRQSSQVQPEDNQYHHSYAMWSLFKYENKPTWRVEEFLGLNRATSESVQEWQKVVDDSPEADLVILDDADLGFRNHSELWPMALNAKGKNRPWILLKMARPLANGPLWEHLHKNFSDRLIVVATVDDLRLSEVQISRELSWERTAQDVFWELVHNPCVNSLSHCAHVVISFGPAGAILLSRQAEKKQPAFQCSLFFDPKIIERMWEKDYPGGMIGYTTCLSAGLVRQWLLSPDKESIQLGIQSGLSASRTLHLEGYGERGAPAAQARLVFPIDRIVSSLAKPLNQFAVAPIQNPVRFIQQKGTPAEKPLTEGFWTILQDKFKGGLDQVATQIVLEGPEVALLGVPWGQFGDLLTVDRQEIESYRSIRNLVAEYAKQKKVSRPLSIAVFGTPGSGKSFGVTEMAKSLLPDQIVTITFNLSQFDTPDELLSALHQVRDIGLSGKLPLVFWDEFDTSLGEMLLGWLRYFLAPMQDGKFQEGQISHPIGRAIFVFAGGTSSSMAEFNKGTEEYFKSAKGPDFVSRLKGFINVMGPNPVKATNGDPYFIIRRAILLRSSLKRGTPQLFEKRGGKDLLNIDRGVLRALLKIGQFKHGARSIESLLAMSQLSGKTAFERSCLPSESQLDLHVEGREFLSMVQHVELEGQILEDLAEAAHTVYCEGERARGYKYGPEKDENLKTNDILRAYAELPENIKEANRLNVRDIPTKLAVAGYIMIPARSNEPPFNFPGKPLELLAEAEHERWMQSKLDDGWKYAAVTNKAKKLHNCLVPWKKLPENEKEKDRDLVRGIPAILARAGYAIVKASA
jgi:RyR domain